jgi:CHAP domain
MRTFKLTSPEMRGADIQSLQRTLNERLEHYRSRMRIKVNGIYDRETAHAVAVVAYSSGLQHYDGIPAVTMRIEHQHLRNPEEIHLAHKRAEERIDGSGLDGILTHALTHVGVHEEPAESNWGEPYPAGWEKNFGFESGVSWCGCFAGSMILAAGGHVTDRVAFCPYIEADARAGASGFEKWVTDHQAGVQPGWLVLYNWYGGDEPEHVGIVKEVLPTHLVTVEGNTSGTNPSDGGMVAVMERPYNFVVGYALPRI